MKLEFKETANAIFEDISKKFSTNSEKQIGDMLNPLKERLGEFQKTIVDSFATQGKEQHTLKAEIEKIVLQADGLTKALRGDSKAQGNWGEVMLERILEESGLQKGIGYVVQGVDLKLTSSDGSRRQPDVIVNLPDNKHIVIDSKVSLTAYERYCADGDDTSKEAHLRDFLRSVKTHVDGLAGKSYQDNNKLNTPDFVLMFMPIEGAYSLAVQKDQKLHSYAWEKRIVIVCPSTLFVTLRTIASVWRIETQNRHTQEIANQGGALYDKFVGFIQDMEDIGKLMGRLHGAYDEAFSKLSKGRGNLISRVENLKELGAKASKSLPKNLADAKADEEEEQPKIAIEG